MLGTTVAGRYRLTAELGSGGMGAVYRATHLQTGRTVALKVLRDKEWLQRSELLLRFEREARATGAVASEHIVEVLDAGRDDETGMPFLAMSLLEGEDLRAVLRRLDGPIPPATAMEVARQTLLGLEQAHAVDVVHRDIKPANLFLADGSDGLKAVKILDFGIAKLLRSNEIGELTETGSVLGSPRYMAPEQVQGLKSIDQRADLWSVGAVLYHMLSGHTPHDDCEASGELMVAICTKRVMRLTELAPWVPTALAEIVDKALTIDPARRFPNARSFREALDEAAVDKISLRDDTLRLLRDDERRPLDEPAPPASDTLLDPGVPTRMRAIDAETGAGVTSQRTNQTAGRRRGITAFAVIFIAVAAVLTWRAVIGTPTTTSSAATGATGMQDERSAPADDRRVTVDVEPPNATVRVDGTAVPVQAGRVSIRGALGSAHRVEVERGDRSRAVEVAITDEGAVPARVTLDEPQVMEVAAASASAVATPAPAPRTPSITPKSPSVVDTAKNPDSSSVPHNELDTQFE